MTQNTEWFELVVPVNAEISDAVSNFLFEQGAAGIEDKEQKIKAYFSDAIDKDYLLKELKAYYQSLVDMGFTVPDQELTVSGIKDRDWNAEWKLQFKPFCVTPQVMIKPTWCELPEDHPEIIIELDPEMAFGTGTHATTALCAQLIDEHVKDKTVLDAGTGTGILAIIAQRLGAAKSFAFDIDPIASETARKNIDKNGVSDIHVFTGTTQSLKNKELDIIVANINSGQILNILPHFNELLCEKGVLILSGILDSEEEKLRAALIQNRFQIKQLLHREEWIAFECVKIP